MDTWEKRRAIQTDDSQLWSWSQERGGRVIGHEARERRRQTVRAREAIATYLYSEGVAKVTEGL